MTYEVDDSDIRFLPTVLDEPGDAAWACAT